MLTLLLLATTDEALLTYSPALDVSGKIQSVSTYTSIEDQSTMIFDDLLTYRVHQRNSLGQTILEWTSQTTRQSMDGTNLPVPKDLKPFVSQQTRNRSGQLVAITAEPDNPEMSARINQLINPIFSPKPVKPGDQWTTPTQPDPEQGFRSTTNTCKLISLTPKQAVLEVTADETNTNQAIRAKGTITVNRTNGLTTNADLIFKPVRLPGGDSQTYQLHLIQTTPKPK